jgi:hypothetical protein
MRLMNDPKPESGQSVDQPAELIDPGHDLDITELPISIIGREPVDISAQHGEKLITLDADCRCHVTTLDVTTDSSA